MLPSCLFWDCQEIELAHAEADRVRGTGASARLNGVKQAREKTGPLTQMVARLNYKDEKRGYPASGITAQVCLINDSPLCGFP